MHFTHLAFINMVIRVYRFLGTHLAAHQLNCTVADNLIDIHVRLCT